MIPRYSRPEMTRIWSPENRYRIWFEIEAHACDAQAALGVIPEARFVHQGMTSSDVLDTCLAVQLKEAADLLLADLDQLLAVLKRRAVEHKYTPTVGRSHG